MAVYNQAQASYNAQNSNSVALFIGDVAIAFAQTVGHSFGLGTQALHGVGSAMPQENQQMVISPRISVDRLALTPAGVAALAGGNNLAYLLRDTLFDLHIVVGPAANQAIWMTYVSGTAENYSSNIPANSAVTETFSFLCMDVLNAAGDSILNDGDDAFSVPNTLGAAAGVAGLGLNLNAP